MQLTVWRSATTCISDRKGALHGTLQRYKQPCIALPNSATRLQTRVLRATQRGAAKQRQCIKPSAATAGSTDSSDSDLWRQKVALPVQQRWHNFRTQPSAQLVEQSWHLLFAHLWPLIVLFSFSDGVILLLTRCSHRLTNEVAMKLLSLGTADIGNLWSLTANPHLARLGSGYSYICGFMLLAGLPITLLVRTMTVSAAVLLCNNRQPATSSSMSAHVAPAAPASAETPAEQPAAADPSSSTGPDISGTTLASQTAAPATTDAAATTSASQSAGAGTIDKKKGFRPNLKELWATGAALRKALGPIWKRVFIVDLLVTIRVLPLQVASLALLSLPWTLPRLLDLQAANPAAILDGLDGKQAIARSKEVVQPVRRAMAVPFFGLIVLAKIMGPLRLAVLARLPQRYYWDLPEIPLAAYFGITLFGVVMQRLHDLLPLALYRQARQPPVQSA